MTAESLLHTHSSSLAESYTRIRRSTEALCDGLATEDYVVQSMDDVSPTKWHLAHTSWFFETFVLRQHLTSYRPVDEAYAYLFNSYYVHAGERHCRAQRGYLSRPTVGEVYAYRARVDAAMEHLFANLDPGRQAEVESVVTIGLHHEQQHQELILTDLKHLFSVNPLRPVYRAAPMPSKPRPGPVNWIEYEGGLTWIGHEGESFAFDNESPRHRVFIAPFAIADRLVTNEEYLAFMADGGYQRPELWLSMGWATARQNDWTEPFYWERRDGEWWNFTLTGMRPVALDEPVCHLSYFEADAFARWAGARLPTEAEWEFAARELPVEGNFVENGYWHPGPAAPAPPSRPGQMFGDVWEWTRSQYDPYPGYRPRPGALGEYNGKFMCNQFVLRGGSCATPASHIRATYRNFFPPDATWQFSGMRLATDI